jgi:hypothetical protein
MDDDDSGDAATSPPSSAMDAHPAAGSAAQDASDGPTTSASPTPRSREARSSRASHNLSSADEGSSDEGSSRSPSPAAGRGKEAVTRKRRKVDPAKRKKIRTVMKEADMCVS